MASDMLATAKKGTQITQIDFFFSSKEISRKWEMQVRKSGLPICAKIL